MGGFRIEKSVLATGCLIAALVLWSAVSFAAGPVPGKGTWETTLQPRDLDRDGVTDAYYDTDLNITWLRNANLGAGTSFDAGYTGSTPYFSPPNYTTDGRMTFNNAKAWASSLRLGGYSDWRLPALTELGTPCCGANFNGGDSSYNVSTATSELAHLFHVTLGNLSKYDTSGVVRSQALASPNDNWLVNAGDFLNLQRSTYYAQARNPSAVSGGIWYFDFGVGSQGFDPGTYDYVYVIAVRDGDILPVPELEVWGMMAAGLVLLGIAANAARKESGNNRKGGWVKA